ncbi:chromate efflux transporter [Carboxydochorda subterranea]|uniref:Chromate efflux transporter n=1 Tax=Carboxydichorda subterranea TaxID=3109565 RepID=A0ABZ1BX84_9FIRM|nr:chromate efflux transporter [Limnochorda sp. L945t]WRP17409.1 chromate efflux transporter [Limnochorda sp. L945t]
MNGPAMPPDREPAASRSAGAAAGSLAEVARVFLKLGTIAFGGPAAHIAMMREEVVQRRKWLPEQRFVDLIGLTNLIPGPNSTEMAIHLGYLRAGWPGLVVAGLSFILPAALMVGALAAAYVAYGSTPQADWVLYGIKPVIIAIVLQALLGLGRTALDTPLAAGWAALVLALYLLGVHELVLLFGGGVAYALAKRLWERPPRGRPVALRSIGGSPVAAGLGLSSAQAAAGGGGVAATAAPLTLPGLLGVFLKVGAVLYGSGYVLLAFLRRDLVERLGWLTDRQLLDAIAVGQFTPGPVFTTATFVGYILGGLAGAILATVAIFLPSFLFVAAVHPLGVWLRRSWWTSAVLDGVNAASLALMAGVTLQLAGTALVDPLTVAVAAAALVALARFRLNSAWLIAGGALLGVLTRMLGH